MGCDNNDCDTGIWERTSKAPAQTRLTAEQLAEMFHEAYERLAPQFSYETRKASAKPWAEVPENNRRLMTAVCAEILKAFRDKSEAKLREEIERLKDAFMLMEKSAIRRGEKLTELRAKLAEQERFTQDWRNATGEANKRTWAAEAEAAALRERERWIPVEESLPEDYKTVQVAHLFKAEGVLGRDANGYHVWIARHTPERWERADCPHMDQEFYGNVTHWKALSAAPERREEK